MGMQKRGNSTDVFWGKKIKGLAVLSVVEGADLIADQFLSLSVKDSCLLSASRLAASGTIRGSVRTAFFGCRPPTCPGSFS